LACGQAIAIWAAALLRITGEKMKALLRKLWLEEEGQDLAEYGLLLILIAVAVVTGITLFKDQIVNAFASATSVLSGS
jgi:Flp pilus assembly pilin Flp